MANPLLAETLEAVAAANATVRGDEERALERGLSVHFMDDDGRFYERTREGVFQIVQVGERWVRSQEPARGLDAHGPKRAQALGN